MMRRRPKEPRVPAERFSTIRQYIVSYLEQERLTAHQLSTFLKIPERDIYEHLEHIRHSLNKDNTHLAVEPAACQNCGYLFRKRGRLSKPGKCPMCRSNLIKPPVFSVERR